MNYESSIRKTNMAESQMNTNTSKRPANLVQTIERVDQLLMILSTAPEGLSLSDLAGKVGLPKGTTHRLVSSLAYFNYIQQTPATRKYKLGFKLATLGEMVLDQIDLRNEAHPLLFELSQKVMEIAHLVVQDNDEALYIDKIQPSRVGLHMSSRIGYRAPLHCTAVGKVFLSQRPNREVIRILQKKGMAQSTVNTITDVNLFKSHLEIVKKEGYAIDDEEHSDGVRCVAAPVFNKNGEIIAAISVSAPAVRVTLDLARGRIKSIVKETAIKISNQFGYQLQKRRNISHDSCN